MTSTKSSRKTPSQFGAAFCWHWRKNWVLTLIYTILLLVALPANFFLQLVEYMNQYWAPMEEAVASVGQIELKLAEQMSSKLIDSFTMLALPLLTLMALLLAVSSFGYLHNRRAVDLYGALPVRRTPMLLGGVAAHLLQMLLPLALALGIVLALGWGYGDLVYPFSGQLVWQPFGLAALTVGIMYLFFLFMIITSGTLLDAALSYGILALGWPALLLCVESLCNMTLPGYSSDISMTAYELFLPVLQLFSLLWNFSVDYCYLTEAADGVLPKIDQWAMPVTVETWMLVWWIVLAVVMLALVCFCFWRRKGEYAESPDAFRLPRAVLRLLASIVGGLGLGSLFAAIIDSNWVFALGAVVGSFLLHLITQAIWNRGLKGFARTLPAYALTVALMVAGGLAVCYDLTGYAGKIPAASEVASITVDTINSWGSGAAIEEEERGALAIYLDDIETSNRTGMNVSFTNGRSTYLTPKYQDAESIQTVVNLHTQLLDCYQKPYLPYGAVEDNGAYYGYVYLNYTLKDGTTFDRIYSGMILTDSIRATLAGLMSGETRNAFRLLYYYPASCMSGVYREDYALVYDSDDGSDSEGYYFYEQKNNGYFSSYELTEAEKEEIWSVFLSELQSDSFTYTAGESSEVQYGDWFDPSERENLSEEAQVYGIEMDQLIREAFPEELLALLDNYLGEQADDVMSVGWGDSYYVPESCSETRALIDQCIAAHTDSPDAG